MSTPAAYGMTDVGCKRQHNEDAMLVDSQLGLYIVADGMGGHAAGEVASTRVVEVVQQHIRDAHDVIEQLQREQGVEVRTAATALVEEAIQHACADIYKMAIADASKRGMGTTCACLVMSGMKGVIGHVGDGRVYMVRAGQCHRLTEDHTFVATQLKAGIITQEEADVSPFRNVITRAVGIQESVQVDTLLVDCLPGDVFMLCSDGLHCYLSNDEVLQLAALPPEEQSKRFVTMANERGGEDNITVVVVACGKEVGVPAEEVAEAALRMEALRKIPLFQHLTYQEQAAILAIASTRTYPADCEIITENQPSNELFVVTRGRVSVEKAGVVIAEVQTRGHFGEMGLINSALRSATVRSLEPTRVMVVTRTSLVNLMRRETVLAVKLLWSFVQVLSSRLCETDAELSRLMQNGPERDKP